MFTGSIVWKGLVYSILMILAKGLVSTVIYTEYFIKIWMEKRPFIRWRPKKSQPNSNQLTMNPLPSTTPNSATQHSVRLPAGPPHSIALLVGLAMIARGEVGFLIASLSQSSGTLTLRPRDGPNTESSGEEIFLVIVWAVVLCTIVGPLGVGMIVKQLGLGNGTWL